MNDDQDNDGRNQPPWFGPKRFGIGYGPRTWQGYLITFVFVLVVIAVRGSGHNWVQALLPACALVVIAVALWLTRRSA